ncbi:uncharacterized protein LOC122622192 [Drosophila teissieri]|uniref:uncharacterized protein LOC122622192 n=1 Tax=Drosophila teissieri TaxID=7243 RepID=UPI001CB9F8F7|nr:uncharacterized protein LOC122622192 [Drosophila teissieri]
MAYVNRFIQRKKLKREVVISANELKLSFLRMVQIFQKAEFSSEYVKFVGRRGLPEKVYSDNATNFVGACNVLKELSEAFHRSRDELSGYAAQRVVFHTAEVRRTLTADELSTHLVEVEALLNSRPIASPGNDPNDGEALTPGHLLIGQPLITLPQESGTGGVCSKASCAYLKRWRMLSALKQQFWDSWSKDYIASLQQRNKWSVGCRDLEVGCLVGVHEDNVPPQRWLTGRVVATTAGEDGRVRVAEIRTSGGVIKRAIHKLALLPVDTAPVEKMKEPEAFNGAGMSEQ